MSELALSNNRPNKLYAAGLMVALAVSGTDGCAANDRNEAGPFVSLSTKWRVADVRDAYDELVASGSIGEDVFGDDIGVADKSTASTDEMIRSLFPVHLETYKNTRDIARASCVAADFSGALDPTAIPPLQALEQEYQDLANEKRKNRVASDIESLCTNALTQFIKERDADDVVPYVLPPGGEW